MRGAMGGIGVQPDALGLAPAGMKVDQLNFETIQSTSQGGSHEAVTFK